MLRQGVREPCRVPPAPRGHDATRRAILATDSDEVQVPDGHVPRGAVWCPKGRYGARRGGMVPAGGVRVPDGA